MSKNEIDFAEHSDRGAFPKYPAGTYKVRLDKWDKVNAKNTNTPQVKWSCTILEPKDCEDGPFSDWLALTDAAGWRTAWFVKEALNLSKEQMKEIGKINTGSERFNKLMNMCKDRTIWFVVEVDPKYDNNKVKEYISDETQDPADLQDLDDIPSFVKQKEIDLDNVDLDKI